ncbi:MAG: hypothetical protein AB8F95_10310 [Bacteroidia bacterium]
MKIFFSIALISFAILLSSCDKTAPEKKEVPFSSEISNDGIAYASLGTPLDSLPLPEGTTVEEELITQDQFQWRVLTIFLPSGQKFIVEGDFVDEGDPAGKLPLSAVNRVQIVDPEFETARGIKVGQSFEALRSAFGDSSLAAVYIADYDVIDISVPGVDRLHYNLDDPAGTIAKTLGDSTAYIPVSYIPQESKIVSIVVSF